MISHLRGFFIWRTTSSLFDEVWIISLSLYIAQSTQSVVEIGRFSSFAAVGDLLGFVIFPWLSTRMKTSRICVLSDIAHAAWMIAMVTIIVTKGISGALIGISALITGLMYATWFASTETLLAKITDRNSIQSLHRWLAISNNVGPLAGPALGSLLFSMLGIIGVAFLNAVIFVGQIFTINVLGSSEPNPQSGTSFYSTLREGLRLFQSNRIVCYLMAFPLVNRLLISGYLPFLTFTLVTRGESAFLTGMIVGCFGIGVFTAAVAYRTQEDSAITARFRLDFFFASMFVPLAIYLSHSPLSPYLLMPVCCLGGFFVSRSQIQTRTLRQLMLSQTEMPYAISGMGIALRLIAPLSGILYSAVLTRLSAAVVAIFLGTIALSIALVFASLLKMNADPLLRSSKA